MLCVDENPSIQALERAQGHLKLLNGRALTGQSHDYKRHGEHIDAYINAYNDRAEPFVWTKKKVRQRQFKSRRITQL